MVFSSASSWPEPRNQIGMELGHSYPRFPQVSGLASHGGTQEAMFQGTWDSSLSWSNCNEEQRSSFAAVLPLSQSHIRSDGNGASHPEHSPVSWRVSGGGIVKISDYGAGVPALSNRLPLEARRKCNVLAGGASDSPVGSSEVMNSDCSRKSISDSSFTDGNLSSGNSSQPKAVLHNIAPDQLSSLISGCPRVFCLNTSGHLLLGNTGVMSILCLCHLWHMSVSEFCEHSGSFGDNPGTSVHFQSGETIAQWRKLLFQKLGIRFVEDQIGWDWPIARSCASVPSETNSCDLDTLLSSSGAFMKPSQPTEKILASKLQERSQNVVAAPYDRERRSQDSTHFLSKGLNNTFAVNFHPVSDNQVRECWASKRCAPDLGQLNADCPSVLTRFGSAVKTGNFSISHPTLQSLSIPSVSYGVNSTVLAKDAVITERDTAFSNIELRLGQPYQKNQPLRNSSFPFASSKLLETNVEPSNSLYLEQLTDNVAVGREKGGSEKYFYSASGTPDFTKGRKAETYFGNHASKPAGVISTSQPEKCRNINNFCSPSTNQLIVSPKGSERSRATSNAIIGSDDAALAHHELHAAKSRLYNISWDATGLERVLSMPDNELIRSEAKGKRMRSDPTYSNTMIDFKVGVQQQFENSCFLPPVTSGSMSPGFATADTGANYQHLPSNLRQVAADGRNMSKNPRRVPSFKCSACTCGPAAMSRRLPAGSGAILQPPAVSRSLSSANSSHVLSFFPVSVRHETANVGPDKLDDQMRLLAQRQISDLSKKHHGVSSDAMTKESDNIGAPDSLKVPHPVNQMHGTLQSTSQTSIGVSSLAVQSTETITYMAKTGEALFNLTENYMEALLSNKDPLYEQAQSSDYGNKNTKKPGNSEKHCQSVACMCFQGNSGYLAHGKQLGETGKSRSGSSCGLSKQLLDSSKDHVFLSEKPFCHDQRGNLDGESPKGVVYDSSLWRDVPRKPKGTYDMERVEWSVSALGKDVHDEGRCADNASKSLIGSSQVYASSKEQEMSNGFFGSPGHAVTQASVDGSDVAHFALDSGNSGGINNPVVDEGSGIDKCWSSEEVPETEASVEFRREGSSKVMGNQSSRSLLDELKLMDSLMWKKGRPQFPTLLPAFEKISPSKSIKRKSVKQKNDARPVHDGCAKCSGCFEVPSCTLEREEVHQPSRKRPCVEPVIRPEKPAFSLTKGNCHDQRDLEDDLTSESDDGALEVPQGKKINRTQIDSCRKLSMPNKATDSNCAKPSSGKQAISFCKKARPVVHGKYGELSCGKAVKNLLKGTKFLSLSRILETSKQCSLRREVEPGFTSLEKLRKKSFNRGLLNFNLVARLKNINEKGKAEASFNRKMNINGLVVEAGRLYAGQDEQSASNLSKLEREDDDAANNGCNIQNREEHIKLGSKRRKVRVRSLYELTGKGEDSSSESQTLLKTSKCITTIKEGHFPKTTLTGGSDEPMPSEVDGENTHLTTGVAGTFPDASCSVCGNLDCSEVNRLLECSQCLIKVHQACYGVSRIPRGDWYCRPCTENSTNLVCVLCGYGGGAMTRALHTQIIITSLLKAWNVNEEQGPTNAARPATMVAEMLSQNNVKTLGSSAGNISNLKMHSSVIEGLLNSGVKQWVHMVCGLWTPGTRCPNVHTMSAFDVSGVSYPRPSTVCSLCNRPGGSCIKCRIITCCVQFHPWCAHQQGLLQSEVEGDNNENVGFYGRCRRHADIATHESSNDLMDFKMEGPRDKEFTCARTEGYKGRKQDGCLQNLYGKPREKGSCFVPQEQVNAWIHMNSQKSRMQELSTIPIITAEYDCRKEYLRYKQAKGWRRLVVYKSGIHALGLYTSRFIPCGEMVVEYIGEIVGPLVADRREKEYESGKNLQYKSACYFFRIDKENIIDATRKGGIARFVNHSCRPNCVAKVISIRNEKKVVFLAERDIYPGEEITYDYHFNHEDEGKKIPCLCNSNNCKHFLN